MKRRHFLGLVLAIAATPLALMLVRPDGPGDWESDMRDQLAAFEGELNGSLSLRSFEMTADENGAHLTTVVQLDWPAGLRRRMFIAEGATPRAAVSAVVDKLRQDFRVARRVAAS